MCVSGCPYKKKSIITEIRQVGKMYFLLSPYRSRQPTVVRRPVSAHRYLGVMLYDATYRKKRQISGNVEDLYRPQLDIFPRPNDPEGHRTGAHRWCWPESLLSNHARRFRRSGKWPWMESPHSPRCIRKYRTLPWSGMYHHCRRSAPLPVLARSKWSMTHAGHTLACVFRFKYPRQSTERLADEEPIASLFSNGCWRCAAICAQEPSMA